MYLKKLKTIAFILAFIMLTTSGSKAAEECFEKTSRAIFKFNMAFDDIILEPIAKGYNKLPDSLKNGTSNFTSNIGILLSIPNNILQGDFKQLGHSVGSFAINTTVGIFGFLIFYSMVVSLTFSTLKIYYQKRAWLFFSLSFCIIFSCFLPIASSTSFFSNKYGAIIWLLVGVMLAVNKLYKFDQIN